MASPLQSKLRVYSLSSLIHRRTLILGDVSAGKTALTVRLLKDVLRTTNPNEITVVDMAPEKTVHREITIGGRMTDMIKVPMPIRVLQPTKVNAPRYSARDKQDLIRQVEENRIVIEDALDAYLNEPTPILFINDLSLYFQSGRWEKVFEAMNKSETFVANTYYGKHLENDLGTGVSAVERELVERIAKKVDIIIHL